MILRIDIFESDLGIKWTHLLDHNQSLSFVNAEISSLIGS